ncbi:MAG: GNAT family N-acetyltransferase [Clostridiaceae bacterium]
MIKETERLELVPLSLIQLKLWVNEMKAFEKELNCSYKGQPVVDFILDHLIEQIEAITHDETNYLYYTSWLIICKLNRIAVGSAAFKGMPNQSGEIEIGYGLGEDFEHHGYMTEAVKEMCRWGLEQENVKQIIAETDLDGYASQRILERNGFERYTFGDSSWWRL